MSQKSWTWKCLKLLKVKKGRTKEREMNVIFDIARDVGLAIVIHPFDTICDVKEKLQNIFGIEWMNSQKCFTISHQ